MKTTSFNTVIATFPAQSIPEAIRFYERLGFAQCLSSGEPIDYVGMRRDSAEIHFFHCADRKIAEWTSCRIAVTAIEDLYRECQQLGIVHPNGSLTQKPWGSLEFAILDNSGCLITFFQRT